MSNKSVSIRQCVLLLILLFPVTSILKVYIGPLNLIMTTVTVLFIMAYYLRCGVNGQAARNYSRLYYQYGFNSLFGMNTRDGSFLSDTFWPMAIGQLYMLADL